MENFFYFSHRVTIQVCSTNLLSSERRRPRIFKNIILSLPLISPRTMKSSFHQLHDTLEYSITRNEISSTNIVRSGCLQAGNISKQTLPSCSRVYPWRERERKIQACENQLLDSRGGNHKPVQSQIKYYIKGVATGAVAASTLDGSRRFALLTSPPPPSRVLSTFAAGFANFYCFIPFSQRNSRSC